MFDLHNGHAKSVNMAPSSCSSWNQRNYTVISSLPPAPLTRQFCEAGIYTNNRSSTINSANRQNHQRVHPKSFHSNATSHKWAFGAIAEMLDNAVDEIQNRATFVIVDKIRTPFVEIPALLIQDDGGGMDPETIRRCMSFDLLDKKPNHSVGKYGNGFRTSTMRLGDDVMVFSRHRCAH
ncbi:hypothetical protein C5167_009444 [Papaver somniferum]|uniref:Histidine kinase/HSP90-like ATPase domain-containing protein n=1 Tax=Papaver somniferum TaxID=3469 RepID=A0A4Y7K1C8_PAPSO|nr:hypothetical protein C5167_009444 [Papaver somniferum]